MAQAQAIISVIGIILNTAGQLSAADAERQRGIESQRIAEERAKTAIVSGQQTMFKERNKTDLVASRALALAAASGGSATDPTTLGVIEDIRGEGAYREQVAMYVAEEDARILRMGGVEARREGESRASARTIGAFGSLVSSGASMYSKYRGSKPPPVTVSDPTYTFEKGYR